MSRCRAYMNGSLRNCTRDTKPRHHQSSSPLELSRGRHPDHPAVRTLAEGSKPGSVRRQKSRRRHRWRRGCPPSSGGVGAALLYPPRLGCRRSAASQHEPCHRSSTRTSVVREADRASEWRRAARESGRGRAGGAAERWAVGACCRPLKYVQTDTGTSQTASAREEATDRLHHTHARKR